MAPIGIREQDLEKYLLSHDIDVKKFSGEGIKTLAEFAEELSLGESSLP